MIERKSLVRKRKSKQNLISLLVLDLFHSLDRSVPVVALCVLKGGFQYFADVCDNLKRHAAAHYPEAIQFNMDFIRLKSYEGSFKGKKVTYSSIV